MAALAKNNYRFVLQEGGNIGKDFWLTEEGLNAWSSTRFSKAFITLLVLTKKIWIC
jgi:hypothetical protein